MRAFASLRRSAADQLASSSALCATTTRIFSTGSVGIAVRSLFVSHISEDAAVAAWLKETLRRDFLEMFDVFVSSDTESIEAGQPWFDTVRKEIDESHALITLCSAESLPRPWVNFEVGAAWMIRKPNIPVCHAGLKPADLPVPLSLYQAITLDEPDGWKRLYNTIAKWFECGIPRVDFDELAREARSIGADRPVDEPAAPEQADDDGDAGEDGDGTKLARRLHAALSEPNPKWRTITWAAAEAGISEDAAHAHFLEDDAVRFSKGKSGATIVGLKRRVGEHIVRPARD